MSALLPLIVVLPALTALIGAIAGANHSVSVARACTVAGAISFVMAVTLAIGVGLHGSVSAVVSNSHGRELVGLYADRITAVLLMLVCGVSAVVQAFAGSYLQGDVRACRFFAAASLLTAATAAMVSAASLVGLGVAWTLAGISLCLLLNLYPGLPAARQGVRRTVLAFAIGDGALWAAIVLALIKWGDLDLRHLVEQAPTLNGGATLVTVFSCLVLVAAMARSAQVPLQGWLPATLGAPTPVSALLHAGVINAGGVLLVRLSALTGTSGPASTLTFCVGAATVLYGTALMLTKPDIKGALAHSTMGQMGFMIMTCGLGAFAAAIFHLVAHGMYKATLFLGSGSAVHRHVRHTKAPPRAVRSGASAAPTALMAALFAGAALISAIVVLHPQVGGRTGSGALLVFAGATAAATAWGIMRRGFRPVVLTAGLAGALAGTWAYVAWLRVFTSFLSVNLRSAGQSPASPWLLAVVVVLLALVGGARLAGNAPRLRALRDTLYVLALSAGHVSRGREPRRRERQRPAASSWSVLEAGSEAVRS